MNNANLIKAARAKNDEFYTQLSDIERELEREEYRAFFSGKVVYCNCDDFRFSQFWKYFSDNFAALNLKKLIATGFAVDDDRRGWRGAFAVKTSTGVRRGYLRGNGDFRSDECIKILREADVVVTNPPFSLFREYVAQLMDYRKKFVILGNKNAVTYKEIFTLFQENKMWVGYTPMSREVYFHVPQKYIDAGLAAGKDRTIINFHGEYVARSAAIWFTNIPLKKYKEELVLDFEYSPELYPHYDNYDAIEVSKTARIPMDYFGVMGVPIAFLDKYNPEQFEIVGNANDGGQIGSLRTYKRLLIRRRS